MGERFEEPKRADHHAHGISSVFQRKNRKGKQWVAQISSAGTGLPFIEEMFACVHS